MKYYIISLGLLLIGGCSNIREQPQYIGTIPSYANKAPHAPLCSCCSARELLDRQGREILQPHVFRHKQELPLEGCFVGFERPF